MLHLRHFANERGVVCVRDRVRGGKAFWQVPENIGYERLLYSPRAEGAAPNDELENWFAKEVDSPAAEVLRKAITGAPLDNREGSYMARFVAAQDLRTPKTRDTIVGLFQAGMNAQYSAWRADPDSLRAAMIRDGGADIPVDELLLHLDNHAIVVNNVAWFDFIVRQLDVAARRLFGMGWSLLRAPNGSEYVTNDIGIVKCVGSVDRPANFVLGFAAGRTHWVFPLSPEFAFAIIPAPVGVKVEAASSWVDAINRQAALDAYRFVYARSKKPNPWLEVPAS